MLYNLQLMSKHLVYLENNAAVLWIFVQRHKINMAVEQNMGIMKARSSLKEAVCYPRVWARYDFN